VHITRQDFNLLNRKEAVDFLLSLYNYREYVLKKKDAFDYSKGEDMKKAAETYMKGLSSLSTHRANSAGKNNIGKHGKPNLNSVQEESVSFDSPLVRHCLEQVECEHLYSYVSSKSDSVDMDMSNPVLSDPQCCTRSSQTLKLQCTFEIHTSSQHRSRNLGPLISAQVRQERESYSAAYINLEDFR
jgi:hypothetical protein